MTPILLASYPRSGSTWLRFILCNLYFPNETHDINSVNQIIPAIEDVDGMRNCFGAPKFLKTHSLRNCNRVIYIYRHIGDVLISEWWYKKKFYNDGRPFMEFLVQCDFGSEWRNHVDHYFPSHKMISYEEMGDWKVVQSLIPGEFGDEEIKEAVAKSTFDRLQKVEEKGFGIYPAGNKDIKFFRSGKSGQWKALGKETREMIEHKNIRQLKALGYSLGC